MLAQNSIATTVMARPSVSPTSVSAPRAFDSGPAAVTRRECSPRVGEKRPAMQTVACLRH